MSHNKLKERVYITGVGCSRFGDLLNTPELKGLSVQELTATAVKEALDDAGLSGQDIDAVFAGNAMVHSSQVPGTYTQLSKWTGTQFKAGVHFEAQCSTTNVGAAMAAMAIASGTYDTVLVYGLETTRTKVKGFSPYEREPISHQQTWLWTDMAVNQAYGVPQGYDIFSTYNGLVALGYCRKYGLSIEDFEKGMFELCRTRRLHGSMTPKANIQQTLEEAAQAKGFSDPFDYWRSADQAMEMAGITAKDIDYLHPHDCSHISGICTAETIGYLAHGKGLHAARDGRLRFDGDRPMSTHGGGATRSAMPGVPAQARTPTKPCCKCAGLPVQDSYARHPTCPSFIPTAMP